MDLIVQNALKATHEFNWEGALASQATIKVFGVGGAGNNMVDWLFKKGVRGAKVIAINTDKVHLDAREADQKILIGRDITKGLGAGGFPNIGEQAARESSQEIKEAVKGSDLVFVCAGLGGGTGTGGAPIVAEIAKDQGAIVVGVVTMPFNIEKARIEKAEDGLQKLRNHCDTVIVIDNNRLVQVAGSLPIQQAFAVANELIATMIKGIVETIAVPSLVNLDFADVRAIMKGGGVSVIGVGESDSENRVEEAVKRALQNPLLDVSYEGATGALIHVTGGQDLTLEEVNRIGELATSTLDPDATVIWGARIQDDMTGKVRVMTIITGVKSPYIVGPIDYKKSSAEARFVSEELGIEILR
ncbi:MAG: cell division protein FtsZ [Candidatus Parvarchaeota archaeon]|nr:cell division protein FtsZ [Candidatus Jingweiarchaeum tengchongense]MCW1298535.1 cell division protein FtsZ [Candidatus Jingweiarchaeum tengchongense]MCW1300219.1 cell division protein FtsZ [Candidatus Jingweiarchaeum tengchongense]MCW1304547.1 cell division protein FtsZ [Candidatus Jingweiarchaeum tengchongense]MCW1305725.1 cell division protein FtsZ [Candidatus Jingweiarchaeum tengchongense]